MDDPKPGSAHDKVDFVPIPNDSGYARGEVLPIPPPRYEPMTEQDWRKVNPPPRHTVTPPEGAPNVVIVLLDQLAYADPDTFGGSIRMPTLNRMAEEGLTYTNFHVNSLCSPTRMSLLTGRNQHQCSVGAVVDASTAFPGDTGSRPDSCATIGEILRRWGYVTSYFGKCHEVPPVEYNVSGPFDHWPARTGFDKFYGYIAGEMSSFNPNLVDGTTLLGTPQDPNYHFNTDMTDKAIGWVQGHPLVDSRPAVPHVLLPKWWSPAAHPAQRLARKGPLQGRFRPRLGQAARADPGTSDPVGNRSTRYEAGRESRVLQKWDTLDDDAKRVYSRQMEVYATLVEHADYEVGRLVDAIDEIGELDNTLFIYIAGDNGGSSIGEINGVLVEWSALNGAPEDVEYLMSRLDEYGTHGTYPNYSVGWAVAGSAPATWCIQTAHAGGNMAGAVIRWPKGFKARKRKAPAVRQCHRHRAHHPRSRRYSRAEDRQRCGADPDRRHRDELHV